MYKIRPMGRNSVALTFDYGYSTVDIVNAIIDEVTKEENGVPYYGYTKGEVISSPSGSTLNYLLGKDIYGNDKRVVLEVHGEWLAIGIGGMELNTSNRMKIAAHYPHHHTYAVNWSMRFVTERNTRMTVYVFAAENWLVIYPRYHDRSVSSLSISANAEGALVALDLAKSDQSDDNSLKYAILQLAFAGGISDRRSRSSSDVTGAVDYKWEYRSCLMQFQTPDYGAENAANYNSRFVNAYDSTRNFDVSTVNGFLYPARFPQNYPGPGQVSEMQAHVSRYNRWYGREVTGNRIEQEGRRMAGIKMLNPNGPYNVLDRIDIKCDEAGFLDSVHGELRNHVILRGYDNSYPQQFYYAIPS